MEKLYKTVLYTYDRSGNYFFIEQKEANNLDEN